MAKIVGNYQTEPIFIAALCSPPSPPNTYLVALSGTQFRQGQPTGLEEIFATSFRLVDWFSTTVVQSLNQMRVPPGATIILAGHSLGGMVAQNLPVLPELGYSQRWRTLRVITFGSPIMNQLRLSGAITRRFAVRGDPIVLETPYWATWLGFRYPKFFARFRDKFSPADISGLTRSPIWVDGGPGFLDPIALHLAYPKSFDLKGYDALGDQPASQILEIDASKQRHFGGPDAAPAARLVDESVRGLRYFVYDSSNPRFLAEGEVGRRGELLITMRTEDDEPGGARSTVLKGAEQFQRILNFFRGQFTSIKGNWQYGTNLATVNRLTAQGMLIDMAVTRTWTAEQARQAGFVNASVLDNKGTPGNYTLVQVIFSR